MRNSGLGVGREESPGILGAGKSKPILLPLLWASDIVSSMHVD